MPKVLDVEGVFRFLTGMPKCREPECRKLYEDRPVLKNTTLGDRQVSG